MNDLEFREQYKRLREVHPMFFSSEEKFNTVWAHVKEMDVTWFRSLVDRIIMSGRGDKIDIGEAVAGERRHRKSKEFADNVIRASDLFCGKASDQGLTKVLEKYGAGNLFEAIQKSKRGVL